MCEGASKQSSDLKKLYCGVTARSDSAVIMTLGIKPSHRITKIRMTKVGSIQTPQYNCNQCAEYQYMLAKR